jgi:hypothetical protein
MRSFAVGVTLLLLLASTASSETLQPSSGLFSARPVHDPWHIDWGGASGLDAATALPAAPSRPLMLTPILPRQEAAQPLHKAAIEHSEAYQVRAKIHKYASFATLPLFAAEVALGQSLYNTPANAGTKRAAHAAVGSGIVGLFAVNTVTGAWNLFGEGRRDTEGRRLRFVHGLLMMAADAGMLATTAAGPNSENERHAATFEADKVTHRNLAVASISVGTVGYLLMLLSNH